MRAVTLRPFWIDACTVSNARFAGFVESTRYVTEAEQYGWSFVFTGDLPDDFPPYAHPRPGRRGGDRSPARTGGIRAAGDPISTGSTDHPVVHVCWNDARRLLRVGRPAAADRGRVGVRVPRRARSAAVPVGRRVDRRRRRVALQHLAGRGSRSATPGRRLPHHGAGADLRAERLRTVQRAATCGSGARTGSGRGTTSSRRTRTRAALARRGPGDARRFVPVSRLVLQPLPRRRPEHEHARELDGQHGIQVRNRCVAPRDSEPPTSRNDARGRASPRPVSTLHRIRARKQKGEREWRRYPY